MEGENISFSYETLWKFIIRPPRDDYTELMLGSPDFSFKGKKYKRKDYEIMSSQGYMMKCSFVEPTKKYRSSIEMPVVLYLHGNSSSRIEGFHIAGELLKRNINLFVIDFPGCGLSEGEYISLGYHESDDVGNVINFIEKLPGVGRIGIWGRSMGAATTMIYAHRDSRVKAICLDSPFADFSKLAKELTLKQVNLPGFLINGALSIVRSTVLKKNGLDIDKLKPIDVADKTFQPAIFIHAINDELINVQHSIDLFNKYGGQEKSLKCCDKGGHNTKRTTMIMNEIGEFFNKYLVLGSDDINNNNDDYIDNYTFYNTNIKDNLNYDKKEGKRLNTNKKENKENKDKISVKSRSNTMDEEEDPFNDKTLDNLEYFKKKDEEGKKQINEIEYLLKSIREDDLEKTLKNTNIINKNEKSNLNNKYNNNINNDNNINNNNIKDKNINKNNNEKINNNFKKDNKYKYGSNNNNNVNKNNINNNNNKNIINSNINFNNWKNGGRVNSNSQFQ